jgi:hypothetical protein
MARHGQWTTFQERLEMNERAAVGWSDRAIASLLGCSLWTVRKWRRRGQRQGRTALTPRLGRAAKGPLSTINPVLRQTIYQLRVAHPGWGPDTILATLRADPVWRHHPLPSRARIAAFLKHAGLTRRYQRHSMLPPIPSEPLRAPHDEWELDAQGAMKVDGTGLVSLITILDVVSRLKVESYPCSGKTKPAWADYQLALRRAFLTYGLPQRITLDRDTVFFDNTTPSPFPTRLHLWLVALGVAVSFTRPRQPTDHARIERTHQTMTRQALLGQTWLNQPTLWAGLDERRMVLNQYLPTRVLNGQAPLEVYPTATHSGRPYRPEWEAELLDLERVYGYLAQGRWFRRTNSHGEFQIATQSYYVGYQFRRRTIEITFDPTDLVFSCRPEGSDTTSCLPVQRLTKAYLRGS